MDLKLLEVGSISDWGWVLRGGVLTFFENVTGVGIITQYLLGLFLRNHVGVTIFT